MAGGTTARGARERWQLWDISRVAALLVLLAAPATTVATLGPAGEFREVFRTTAAADDVTTPYSCAWAPALVALNASSLLLFYEGRTGNYY